MGTVNQREDLLSVVRDLQRQVRELRRRSLFNAAISEGDIQVRTPEGAPIVIAGQIPYGSSTVSGLAVYRSDGTLQARFFDSAGGNGFWALFDEAENILASDDTVAGEGLARPYIPMRTVPYTEVTTPPVAVTSASFVPVFRTSGMKQLARIRVRVLVQTDGATTGEIVLMQGVSTISTTVIVPPSTNDYMILDGTVTGGHLTFVDVDTHARRSAGAGTFRIGVSADSGIQS